jgi:hypothetical protein
MTETTAETDGSIRAALVSVAIVGLVGAGVAVAAFGTRAALGVAIGATAATLNLWALSRLVRAFFARRHVLPWSLIGLLKFVALIAALFFVVERGIADVLPLAIGFGALPVGIVVFQLWAAPKLSEES